MHARINSNWSHSCVSSSSGVEKNKKFSNYLVISQLQRLSLNLLQRRAVRCNNRREGVATAIGFDGKKVRELCSQLCQSYFSSGTIYCRQDSTSVAVKTVGNHCYTLGTPLFSSPLLKIKFNKNQPEKETEEKNILFSWFFSDCSKYR